MARKSSLLAPLDKIVCDRKLREDDDLTDLAEAVRDGLRVPVLVDEEYRLIDGLRRVEAYRMLGIKYIEVDVSSDLDTSLANLERAHSLGQTVALAMTARRSFEIYESVHEQIYRRVREIRRKVYNGPKEPTRERVARAIGIPNATYLGAIATIFRAAEVKGPDQELYQEAVRRFDAREGSLSTVLNFVRQGNDNRRKAMSPKEQTTILSRVALSLGGVVSPLTLIGELDERLDEDMLRDALEQMHAARRVVATTINKIRKVLNSE